MKNLPYLCRHFKVKGYLARVVRDRSAKPGTAVRVRQVPHQAHQFLAGFFRFPCPKSFGILIFAAENDGLASRVPQSRVSCQQS